MSEDMGRKEAIAKDVLDRASEPKCNSPMYDLAREYAGDVKCRAVAMVLNGAVDRISSNEELTKEYEGWHGTWFEMLYEALYLGRYKGATMSKCITAVIDQRDRALELLDCSCSGPGGRYFCDQCTIKREVSGEYDKDRPLQVGDNVIYDGSGVDEYGTVVSTWMEDDIQDCYVAFHGEDHQSPCTKPDRPNVMRYYAHSLSRISDE